ncbi:MAG: hypothetical protein FJ135_03590 [Deltaproteobacteria bacterium]|nr:hypothetical protein [Deltaproteobacteria bacterium]
MRRLTAKFFLSFILVMALLSLPFLLEVAQARGGGGGRGGGGHRGGGMGGGGFHAAPRPSGGAGHAGSIQRVDPGRRDVDASRRDVDVTRNVVVDVDNTWHGGPQRPGRVARAVAVGSVVYALSSAAQPVVYDGTTYYVEGDTYYKQCYQGDEVAYCVVENPNP